LNKGLGTLIVNQELTLEQKLACCKIISSQSKNEYLLSFDYSVLKSLKTNLDSCSEIEIICKLADKSKEDNKLHFTPRQRQNIKAKTTFLKEKTKFTWYFGSNTKLETNFILDSLNISIKCLEN